MARNASGTTTKAVETYVCRKVGWQYTSVERTRHQEIFLYAENVPRRSNPMTQGRATVGGAQEGLAIDQTTQHAPSAIRNTVKVI